MDMAIAAAGAEGAQPLDRVLASMMHGMGVFGAREGGVDAAGWLRDMARPVDYFA